MDRPRTDPVTAYRAQWGLAEADGLAAFLGRRSAAGPPVRRRADRAARRGLDDNSFRAREAAEADLVRLGRLAEPAVRAALGRAASAEQRGRLEILAARFDKGLSPDELRLHRAVQALTWSRDPEARTLLTQWASGMAGAPLTGDRPGGARRRGNATLITVGVPRDVDGDIPQATGGSSFVPIARGDQPAFGAADPSTQRARASRLQSLRGSPGAAFGRAEQVERVDRGRRAHSRRSRPTCPPRPRP